MLWDWETSKLPWEHLKMPQKNPLFKRYLKYIEFTEKLFKNVASYFKKCSTIPFVTILSTHGFKFSRCLRSHAGQRTAAPLIKTLFPSLPMYDTSWPIKDKNITFHHINIYFILINGASTSLCPAKSSPARGPSH